MINIPLLCPVITPVVVTSCCVTHHVSGLHFWATSVIFCNVDCSAVLIVDSPRCRRLWKNVHENVSNSSLCCHGWFGGCADVCQLRVYFSFGTQFHATSFWDARDKNAAARLAGPNNKVHLILNLTLAPGCSIPVLPLTVKHEDFF